LSYDKLFASLSIPSLAVIIPADVDASVLHSAAVGGFDAGVMRPL